ncbi:signal transduction histidine kinase [Clostridium pascui]|uniref:sensor histidine kinase n=1 Tax=Clostridium pascui TaxID=46609 RepID=UPI00195B358A|nr:hybrid sensor histidine kinase/response regulator [Clostridium pascui]MBM7872045.1 signal transduction histidine kinase [Clostridium pascui]
MINCGRQISDSTQIMIVDDTLVNLKLLSDLLSEHGYQVRPVSSGVRALKSVLIEKPDLIILDVIMPEMDGYEVCRQLKLNEHSRDIPVIFISALDDAANKVIGFKAGGVDYITKPFQKEEVLIRVETHLSVSRLQQQLQARNVQLEEEIAQRKRAEEELLKAHEEKRRLDVLMEHDRVRTEFFANISHELRTPINVVFSSLQLYESNLKGCLARNISSNCHKYINTMKQNCYRLLRLTNNLIDITKIDVGYFEIYKTNNNIINLIENITLSVADYIESKGLSIIFDTDIEEKIIACDPDKIERIILNLLSNAVKFTEPGGEIMVSIENGIQNICIKVKDTGRGIPEEKLNLIFERFVQVDRSLTRDHEGSGIGLSIVNALVELHGGTIYANSQIGHGTEIIIYLPCELVEKTEGLHPMSNSTERNNVEKINIEFSDIYK